MRRNTIPILAILVVVFIVAAVIEGRSGAFTSSTGGELLFPGLAAHVNDIAVIDVASGDRKTEIKRTDKDWVVATKDDYPAKFELVKQTIVGLSVERTVEAKTADPALYPRLEVEDPKAKDASSALLTVQDGKGTALASLILGKKHPARSGRGPDRIYVRKPNDSRSWLAEGELDRIEGWKSWVDTTILNLERDLVHEVEVKPEGGRPFTIALEKAGEGDFALKDIPAGQQLKEGADLNAVGAALVALKFDDVMPAKNLKPDAKLLRTLNYKSFDGVVVDVSEYQQDGKSWFKFAASFDPKSAIAEVPAETKPKPPTPKIPGVEVEENEPPKPRAAADAKKAADDIAARTSGWVYSLETGDVGSFNKDLAEFIEPATPKAPEKPEGGETAGPQSKPAPAAPPLPDKVPEQPKQ